jgi:hypothetical protein
MNKQKRFMPLPTWLYIVGLIFFIYLFINVLQFSVQNENGLLVSGMYLINFGVHEVSHLIVFFLPSILVAAAGSFGEVSFTLLLLAASLKAKSYFAACFAGIWVMLGFMSAGQYMADSRAQSLPLIGPGETVQHDWNFVFSQLGWLNADAAIGSTVQGIGIIIGALSIATAAYFVLLKITRA